MGKATTSGPVVIKAMLPQAGGTAGVTRLNSIIDSGDKNRNSEALKCHIRAVKGTEARGHAMLKGKQNDWVTFLGLRISHMISQAFKINY